MILPTIYNFVDVIGLELIINPLLCVVFSLHLIDTAFYKSNPMTGVTCAAAYANPSGRYELNPGFTWGYYLIKI